MKVILATTDADILKCWHVMHALRPHLPETDFLKTVNEMIHEGYQMTFIEEDGIAASVIGFRYLQFLFNGKHIYIDDLSTLPQYRGKGYGGKLLDYVADFAKQKGFSIVTLDSGHHRSDAHRLYMNKGFKISSHHFSKELS
jgi:GNAT superfamily N-acetyltransferase